MCIPPEMSVFSFKESTGRFSTVSVRNFYSTKKNHVKINKKLSYIHRQRGMQFSTYPKPEISIKNYTE